MHKCKKRGGVVGWGGLGKEQHPSISHQEARLHRTLADSRLAGRHCDLHRAPPQGSWGLWGRPEEMVGGGESEWEGMEELCGDR